MIVGECAVVGKQSVVVSVSEHKLQNGLGIFGKLC